MTTFQITTRTVQKAPPQQRSARRLDPRWAIAMRIFISLSITVLLFVGLLFLFHTSYLFVLLPTLLSMLTVGSKRYSFTLILNSTPLYVLLSFLLALLYYSLITAMVILTHLAADTDHIILVAATLAWVVLLDPVRASFQTQIEQRFNVRNREARKAIKAFTATLREEIDLGQVRERFLTVIQQTLRPYSIELWVRADSPALQVHSEREQSEQSETTFTVTDDDPLVTYALRHPGALEIERLRLTSPLLETLKAHATEVVLPLPSQGELIGLLTLGPRLVDEKYRNLIRTGLSLLFRISPLHLILLLVLGPGIYDDDLYTRQELETLSALATQVAPALRVAQMVQEQQAQVRERERIEQELRTAQAIQKAFLPKDIPMLAGWQLTPYYQPAREVGGDFYDFIALEDGLLGLVIGDVTGKGVPAALVMATVLTMLRSAARNSNSPAEILKVVNDLLVTEIPTGVFVTCFYVLLDPRDGQLRYANAGHEAPYRQRGSNASELWATGMPLGMLPGSRYEEFEAALIPGESLLFYSDGLVEAHSPSGEMFGFPRLQALLSAPIGEPALLEFVLAQLQSFTGDKWEQEDDVTLLTLQRASETV
ncbi:MAG TPA: SpoIIE family protein phosphatase [Ktedonobacteraceae bacterium]